MPVSTDPNEKLKSLRRDLNTLISIQKNTSRGEWRVSNGKITRLCRGLPETQWPALEKTEDLQMMACAPSLLRKYATLLRENIREIENTSKENNDKKYR